MTKRNKKPRMTRQKRAIIDFLKASYAHPTAVDIYDAVKKDMPNLSLGTVYRNLEQLCDQNECRKIVVAGKTARYDAQQHSHEHIKCQVCHKIADVSFDAKTLRTIEQMDANLKENVPTGWTITAKSVEIQGICPACQEALIHLKTGQKKAEPHHLINKGDTHDTHYPKSP